MSPAPARVALFGFGLAGRVFHAPLIAAEPGLELAVVVTRDPISAARQVGAAYPAAEVVDGPEAVWERAPDLDLVVVATPNRAHVAAGPGRAGRRARRSSSTSRSRRTRGAARELVEPQSASRGACSPSSRTAAGTATS